MTMRILGHSLLEPVTSFLRSSHLIYAMAKRDVLGRYRGSVLGILWSFFNPILMLAVYTFVFSVIFKARWSAGSDSKAEFALILFAGMTVFGLFSECITRAPSLILNNSNYVKKVVFPIEILPWVAMGSAFFHMIVSLIVWLFVHLIVIGIPHATALLLPVVLVPLVLLTIGISWVLASLGVYLRDVGHAIGIVTNMLMFLTPIFYPASALPDGYRQILLYNPLAFIVEQARVVLIWGNAPDWAGLAWMTIVTGGIAWLGFVWFQKTRRGFADVL